MLDRVIFILKNQNKINSRPGHEHGSSLRYSGYQLVCQLPAFPNKKDLVTLRPGNGNVLYMVVFDEGSEGSTGSKYICKSPSGCKLYGVHLASAAKDALATTWLPGMNLRCWF